MYRLSRSFDSRRIALAGLLAIGLSTSALAAGPSHGLGEAWPQSKDVSSVPGWHVYVLIRDGVKYIQINDAAGNVRAAVATANGEFLVLPMGSDAQRVATTQQPQTTSTMATAAAPALTVYNDGATRITVRTARDGTASFAAARAADCGAGCGINHVAQ